jgi:2-polyprenyl-3-methyl-5-hydroxy-6-metoxy-1,4-benzoquinol methylase
VDPVPGPEVLRDYYDNAYEVDREQYRRNILKHGQRDIKMLEGIGGRGRMLEAGCSWGFFLDAARKRGWKVDGIELSDSAAKWAREKLGLDVMRGMIDDCSKIEEKTYDVIVAWHVIEHVQEPNDFLRRSRKGLRTRGLLALRTPNIQSVPARINGRVWHWVGAPAHLSLFSPKSLQLALEENGFVVRHISTRRGDAYNPIFETVRCATLRLGLHHRIKRLLKLSSKDGMTVQSKSGSREGNRRIGSLRRVNRLFDLVFFVLYPIEKLFAVMGGGPEIFVIAERKD